MDGVPRWRRIVRAAARLAALYGGAVVILLLAAYGLSEGVLPTISELVELYMPFAVTFLIAFVLLAVARRAGFLVLWTLLLVVWLVMLRESLHHGVGQAFVMWTILALPLYGIGMIGAPSARPVVRKTSLLVVLLWFSLLAAAFVVDGAWTAFEPSSSILKFLFHNEGFIWRPFPFLLGAYELVRVWAATGQMSVAAATGA